MTRFLAVAVRCRAARRRWLATDAHAQAAAAKVHVDAARAAVAPPKRVNPNAPLHSFKALFDQVCAEPKLPDAMRTNDRSAVVPRKEWFAWPVEIFDNLYFIGTKTAGVWAVSTSDGIIVIDTNFHYNSKELVLGLLNFGLDPNDIKYIIVTHAHDDRYWGAKAPPGHVSERARGDVRRRLGRRGEGQLARRSSSPGRTWSSPTARRSRSAT